MRGLLTPLNWQQRHFLNCLNCKNGDRMLSSDWMLDLSDGMPQPTDDEPLLGQAVGEAADNLIGDNTSSDLGQEPVGMCDPPYDLPCYYPEGDLKEFVEDKASCWIYNLMEPEGSYRSWKLWCVPYVRQLLRRHPDRLRRRGDGLRALCEPRHRDWP